MQHRPIATNGWTAHARLQQAAALFTLLFVCGSAIAEERELSADVCVYGATSGGVIAAIQAQRCGRKAILIDPGQHLGGMTSGGLGAVDIGDPRTIGGLTREYFTRLTKQYDVQLQWSNPNVVGSAGTRGTGGGFSTEPGMAERVFKEMLEESQAVWLPRAALARVDKTGARVQAVELADGRRIQARIYIDASYEGDLLALAGVTCIIGRESQSQYDEPLAGIQPPPSNPRAGKFTVVVDPFQIPGDPNSGVLPLVQDEPYGEIGAADHRVQSYNYRLCLTNDPANRRVIEPPPGYEESHFELLARWIAAREAAGQKLSLADFCKFDELPRRKFDFNNRWPISTDYIGGAHDYAAASPEQRREIARAHEDYLRGFFYFLAHSDRSPRNVRDEAQQFGLALDEFTDNDNWPNQLYLREVRRMVSDFVMTQQHVQSETPVPHPVGLGAYGIDLHAVRRIPHQSSVINEGSQGGSVKAPYPIAYDALVPRRAEADNVLAPFCLSASHVAFGSIRMEPVFMVLAQSAATAGSIAIQEDAAVQDVKYDALRDRLLQDGQVLAAP